MTKSPATHAHAAAGARAAPVGTPVDGDALDARALGLMLQPRMRALRARVLALLAEDVFRPRYGEGVGAERRRTNARIARIREVRLFDGVVAVERKELGRAGLVYDCVMSCVALLDHSLEIKIGVSLGLFAPTVRGLGSVEQGREWLPGVERMDEFGCFALTELGHGSNAKGIETTATYDSSAGVFDLHTPNEAAQKYWIGGAAETATLGAVFAQLVVGGERVGVHAFVVRMRHEPFGETLPGVHVADCGAKTGLNGVDNGRIWFDHVKVPRAQLLCGSSEVSEAGVYTSRYRTPEARFGAALAALSGGRVGVGANAVNAAKTGLAIAVKYTSARRAFSPGDGQPEVPLLGYSTVQYRLMVPLAGAYLYSFCADDLRERWLGCVMSGKVPKEMHVLSAGFKAAFTWYMAGALQHAREVCGGQGYKSENRISLMRADRDVTLTFEGANDVMMQQVAKEMLSEYARTGGLLHGDVDSYVDGGDDARAGDEEEVRATVGVTDPAFIHGVLRARELALTRQLAMQMARSTQGQGMSHFDAWNAALRTAADAAEAYVQRRAFDMHHTRHLPRAEAAGGECAAAVRLCGELFFLDCIDRDAACLRLGCISREKAAEAREAVGVLSGRMAGIAGKLVDGFEIPRHLLAPIAFDYVAHNSRAKL